MQKTHFFKKTKFYKKNKGKNEKLKMKNEK